MSLIWILNHGQKWTEKFDERWIKAGLNPKRESETHLFTYSIIYVQHHGNSGKCETRAVEEPVGMKRNLLMRTNLSNPNSHTMRTSTHTHMCDMARSHVTNGHLSRDTHACDCMTHTNGHFSIGERMGLFWVGSKTSILIDMIWVDWSSHCVECNSYYDRCYSIETPDRKTSKHRIENAVPSTHRIEKLQKSPL